MTRFLIKPLVYLLVFGLLGCTSTKWTVLDQSTHKGSFQLIRVMLTDGESVELKYARVTDEEVSGTKGYKNANSRGEPFTVSTDQVQLIEIADRAENFDNTAVLLVAVTLLVIVAVGAVMGSACCSGSAVF